MGVPQYTTPTFLLTFEESGLDLVNARDVYVTFESGRNKFTKTGNDLALTEKTIGVHLSQSETGNLYVGDVRIQANWITADGERCASEIVTQPITEQLLRSVIE